jgi:hypothetical protein
MTPSLIMLVISVWTLIGFALYMNAHRAPEERDADTDC